MNVNVQKDNNFFSNHCKIEGVLVVQIYQKRIHTLLGNWSLPHRNILKGFCGNKGYSSLSGDYLKRNGNDDDDDLLLINKRKYLDDDDLVIIVIPILDVIIENMENNAKWFLENIWNGEIINIVKKSLRDSVHYLLKKQLGNDIEYSSSVDKIIINILYSAMYELLKAQQQQQQHRDDSFIRKIRGLMGLLFLIASTSENMSLNSVWGVLIFEARIKYNDNQLHNIREEFALIDIILNLWPLTKIDDLDIRTNISKCCERQIKDFSANVIEKNLLPRMEKYYSALNLTDEQIALSEIIHPLVTFILNHYYPRYNIEKLDYLLSRDYKKPTLEKIGSFTLTIPQSKIPVLEYFKFNKDLSTINKIESKMKKCIKNPYYQYLLNYKRIKKHNQRIDINSVITFYKSNIKTHPNFNYYKNKFELLKKMEELINVYDDDRNEHHHHKHLYLFEFWDQIQPILSNHYFNDGILLSLYLEEIIKILNKILVEGKYTLRDVREFNSYFKEEGDNYSSNNNNVNILFIQLRQMRALLFHVVLSFISLNKYINYDGIPQIIKTLSECNTLQDFFYIYLGRRVNALNDEWGYKWWADTDMDNILFLELKDYVYSDKRDHFNNNLLRNKDLHKKTITELQILYKKDLEYITKNKNIQIIWRYYHHHRDDDDDESLSYDDEIKSIVDHLIPRDMYRKLLLVE